MTIVIRMTDLKVSSASFHRGSCDDVVRAFHEGREEYERRRAGRSMCAGLLGETSWTDRNKRIHV
jgi:hypothetical protein